VTIAGLLRRRLGADDLLAVLGLLAAADQAVLGRTDFTVTEVESDLRDERKEYQGWYDDVGALVDCARLRGRHDLHPDAHRLRRTGGAAETETRSHGVPLR